MMNGRFSSLALALFLSSFAFAAACGGVVQDAEKGVKTTEKEIKGSNGTKDVEQGVGTLQKDVNGKGRDGGADPSDKK